MFLSWYSSQNTWYLLPLFLAFSLPPCCLNLKSLVLLKLIWSCQEFTNIFYLKFLYYGLLHREMKIILSGFGPLTKNICHVSIFVQNCTFHQPWTTWPNPCCYVSLILVTILNFFCSYERLYSKEWNGRFVSWQKENTYAKINTCTLPGANVAGHFVCPAFDACTNPYLGLASIKIARIDSLRKNLSLPAPVGKSDNFLAVLHLLYLP